MRAALAARVPYSDLGGLYHGTQKQFELHDDFVAAGVPALLGMGSTPGITNAMAGFLARELDAVHEAHVRVGCLDRGVSGAVADSLCARHGARRVRARAVCRRERHGASGAADGAAKRRSTFRRRWAGCARSTPCTRKWRCSRARSRVSPARASRWRSNRPSWRRSASWWSWASPAANRWWAGSRRARCCSRWAPRRSRREGLASPTTATACASTSPARSTAGRCGDAARRSSARIASGASAPGALDTGVPLAIAGLLLARREVATPGVLCPETALPFERFFEELARRGIRVAFSEQGQLDD